MTTRSPRSPGGPAAPESRESSASSSATPSANPTPSTTSEVPPRKITPADISDTADRLGQQDQESFIGDLGDHLWWMASATTSTGDGHEVTHEDLLQEAAYRTPALANRSLRALRRIRSQGKAFVPRLRNDSDDEHSERRGRFQRRLAHEEQLLEIILAGLKAQQGVLVTPRNAWGRARRRLAQLNMEQDLPRGTITDLVAEERSAGRRR